MKITAAIPTLTQLLSLSNFESVTKNGNVYEFNFTNTSNTSEIESRHFGKTIELQYGDNHTLIQGNTCLDLECDKILKLFKVRGAVAPISINIDDRGRRCVISSNDMYVDAIHLKKAEMQKIYQHLHKIFGNKK